MARIAGVNIPTQKRVVIALQYIHGIGPKFAKDICGKVGVPDERRVNQLTDAEVLQIRESIDRDAKTITVRVYCPGRFDEGFEATARYDTRENMHADVAIIQVGVRAEKVASDKRHDDMMARLDAEFAADRAERLARGTA